jgi:hypothetical protein
MIRPAVPAIMGARNIEQEERLLTIMITVDELQRPGFSIYDPDRPGDT